MAYVYDNKTYRNLQQQVKENMDNIAELQEMKLVGIDVAGIVADYSSLPSSAEQGQVYAVGTSSPYELYVYNDSSWVYFGEFPKAGPQGEQGPQGEPGRQGPRGLTGPQGPRGYTGATGAQGPQGPAGADGPQGPRGPQGPKGQDGTVSFDELTPTQIDMLKGPKGDKGDTGAQGPQGPQGIQGTQGIQGPAGKDGSQGPRGLTGPQGPRGYTGAPGTPGQAGPKGERGPQGEQGPQGIQGPKGDKGDIGPQGPQGPIGPEGPKGDKGDTGERGPQGPIGPQGPKGDPGEVPADVATKTYVSEQLSTKQDKLDSYSDSASVANDKLTINYKVKQEDGTYSNVPVEFSGGSKYTFTNGLTETNGTVSWDLKDNYAKSLIKLSLKVDGGEDTVTYMHNYNGSDDYLTFKPRYYAEHSKRLNIVHENSDEGLDIYLDKNFNGSSYFAPRNNSTTNLGKMNSRWKTLYCNNLSDGTKTKTMTEVLSGTTEEWTFTLSDGTTVTKKVKLGE